ncbi:MAG: hypothetical protein M3250_08345 [Thermoproteota archaeon]|nr:hypothetical protein [Thermoproteota archaeon]
MLNSLLLAGRITNETNIISISPPGPTGPPLISRLSSTSSRHQLNLREIIPE